MLRKLLVACLVVGVLAVILFRWASRSTTRMGGVELPSSAVDEGATKTASAATSTVNVVTWNIAWAFGWGSDLVQDVSPKTQADLDDALVRMGRALRDLDADVVLLQEVDFDADRSFRADQARKLAAESGLRFYSSVVSWDVRYVPFPYWPPRRHIGRVRSGGAILSRWPLSACSAELFEKPDHPFWYNAFYLFRYAQSCNVMRPGAPFRVVNVHLEAYDRANRERQAGRLADLLSVGEVSHTILGGDFNTVPPEVPVRSNYEDEPDSDHRGDTTLDIVRGIKGMRPTIGVDAFRREPARWMTFPSHAPNRTLDYLFGSTDVEVVEASVPRHVGSLSDHLPVVARMRL